jgi:hypothetical protein
MSSPRPASKSSAVKRAAKPKAAAASAHTTTEPAKSSAAKVSTTATTSVAHQLAKDIERGLADGNVELISPEALQDLMAALCKSYSAQLEAGGEFLPLRGRTSATSTDVMTTASGLLRAANLAVFELGMWQSWTGR